MKRSAQGNGSSEVRLARSWIAGFGIALCAVFTVGCNEGNGDAFWFDNRPVGQLEDSATLKDRDDLNVVFILIDTLRADHLGSYGYERDTSPVMDYFAATGVRFDRHRAQSTWTKASMASLWTSLYPQRIDVLTHRDTVTGAASMPAEIFRDAGFYTVGIWRNGWVAPNFGFRQGFEIYMTPNPRQAPAEMRRRPVAGRIDGTDIDAIFAATEFLRVNQDRRFFLYIHLMDVHQYISNEDTAIFGTSFEDGYDNSIRWEDFQVGEVFAQLFRLDLAKKTLVFIVSDHGEAFGEHGIEGHARDLHHEVTNTPWIIAFPFKLEPGTVFQQPTQNVDVVPTLLDLVGLPLQDPTDGRSRAPWLRGEFAPDFPDRDFAQLDRTWGRTKADPDPIVALRDGNYRLLHDVNHPELDRLYDVGSDRVESTDIAEDSPGILKTLRSTVLEYLEQPPAFEGGAPEIELDEMSLRQLRALGYSIED
ncbi:MAG: sulfatase [Myxococcota bacterium]